MTLTFLIYKHLFYTHLYYMYIFGSWSLLVKELMNIYFAHLSFCSVIFLGLWLFSKIVVYCVGSIQMIIRISQATWKFEELLLRVDCEYGVIECIWLLSPCLVLLFSWAR